MNFPSEDKEKQNQLQNLKQISVNDEIITPDQIIHEMQHHESSSQDEIIKKSSEVLIIQLLLLQKAKELGLDEDLSPDSNVAIEETIISRLIAKEVARSDEITEEDCQKYYNLHTNDFLTKEMLELKHILISVTPKDKNSKNEAKKLAMSIIEHLKESIDKFDFLVNEHSQCPSKNSGGSLGRVARGQFPPNFEKEVFDLDKGLHDKPIKSDFGYHIVLVEKRLPPQQLEFEQVKGDIADMLIEIGHRIELSKYTHQLIKDANIKGVDFEVGSVS
jgi:peptidyl-prolyl cis-trans isomerase C